MMIDYPAGTFTNNSTTRSCNFDQSVDLMIDIQKKNERRMMTFNAQQKTSPCRVCGWSMIASNVNEVIMCEHQRGQLEELNSFTPQKAASMDKLLGMKIITIGAWR